MKKFLKKYRATSRLVAVGVAAFALCNLGLVVTAFALMAVFQLCEIAMSKSCGVLYNTVLTPEQVKEFDGIMKSLGEYKELFPQIKDLSTVEGGFAAIKGLPALLTKYRTDLDNTSNALKAVERQLLKRSEASPIRKAGSISEAAAKELGMRFVVQAVRSNRMEGICPDEAQRKHLMAECCAHLGLELKGIEARAALTTTEVPLPSTYYGQIEELIAEYGVIRSAMMNWPLGGGTDKPARSSTGFEFGSIAMSAEFTEKTFALGFASLESHKIGGLVITPRELREQSIVALGQYLAKMASVRFAWAEDKWGFLADGSATYESVTGVCKTCDSNSKTVTLGAGKTSTSDITVANLRAAMGLVNSRVLSTGKWYMHASWMPYLPELNTEANQYTYREVNGTHYLLGRPIVWTEVLAPYTTNANAGAYAIVFGSLEWWWFAQRGAPRIDESEHLYFHKDQIATRFIEEIDFDYMALDAAATIKTAS